MTKDNNFRLEFPTDTEVMGADMSEPPKPPTVASQESDVNGVSDFSVFEDYGDYSNEIPRCCMECYNKFHYFFSHIYSITTS